MKIFLPALAPTGERAPRVSENSLFIYRNLAPPDDSTVLIHIRFVTATNDGMPSNRSSFI